ncbi:LOW QUALITY PROTEIN: kelch domain-containing protein 4-like [Pollicipes pollicipes]|uniref:LOW QUALITY PROTEIN: kelch domain-containing protein 4-like n=1 Tax=Pollicipes pollicipes TaxID=41117 RepID=UPI001884C358|nr:LOW QUALITY PROTEIN: kelch domain-containing protein 4-like [Pollicipes pollicipes]
MGITAFLAKKTSWSKWGKKIRKRKGQGIEKTAAKTEKNLSKKLKKQLTKKGEESVELMIGRLVAEEELKKEIVEKVSPPPPARSSFTMCAHPERDEILLYGGEYFNGKNTTVFGDLYQYRCRAAEWRLLQYPRGPPPRCAHAAVAAPLGGGQLWLFGGEFSSPSGEQFHHYRDLWCLHTNARRWEKISAAGGPSARSGHRMVYYQKQLIVFGGFHDNLQSFQYFNDLHAFDIDRREWRKLEVSGQGPSARSSVAMLALADGRVLVYGGYCKEKVKKNVEKGTTFSDMYRLTPDKHDLSLTRWRWSQVKQSGARPSHRSGMSGCLVRGDSVLFFGGVTDEESDDKLKGTFFNDMYMLDAGKGVWHTVTLSGRRDPARRRRRRRAADDPAPEPAAAAASGSGDPAEQLEAMSIEEEAAAVAAPSPRARAGLAARAGQLFLYGGQLERGSVEVTLSDFYQLGVIV